MSYTSECMVSPPHQSSLDLGYKKCRSQSAKNSKVFYRSSHHRKKLLVLNLGGAEGRKKVWQPSCSAWCHLQHAGMIQKVSPFTQAHQLCIFWQLKTNMSE
eukprot:TRINITY_DN5446_c0_g2_i1.p2 TRINITY_DN5446_c0_g2~~TRINITY_DN5446_c0_g2_i1.p2  ORF type:complete len:101 (+),score=6.01 TRINITY_DN5446_c0_g2_i1:240-542(+)